ncbi:zinc finger protein 700-like isoform X2 [Lytechinus pictus]|uniref:zinc finger protein 700-like isoform X1 n=1 Tax=Lytechinus pictus TaxID=7653 RepID=UPI0030BA233A
MESDMLQAVHSFQCQFCEEVFSSSIQMAQHWQDHHQEDHIEQETSIYHLLQTTAFGLTQSMANGASDVLKGSSRLTDSNHHVAPEKRSTKDAMYEENLVSEETCQGLGQTHSVESSSQVAVSVKSSDLKSVPRKGLKDFCCEICGRTYTTTSNLNKHYRTHTGVLYFCSLCQKGFRYKESLKKHEKCHTQRRIKNHDCVYQCQFCHKNFPDKLRLSIHFRSHPMEKTHKCNQCERTFLYKSGLRRHMLSHASEKAHICPHCTKSFLTLHSLKAHIKTHSGKKPFSCDKCKKAFAQKLTLIEHMKLHEDTRSYKCSYCGKGFHQRSTLWGHEKLHKREKVHRCSKCEEQFGTLKELRRHEKKHWLDSGLHKTVDIDGEPVKDLVQIRRFECDLCGEAFTQKAVLQTHYRRHTGEKPFKCNVCGKQFRHLASSKRHGLIHKGIKQYHCDICGKSFTKKSYLKWHVSKLHSTVNDSRLKVCDDTCKGNLEATDSQSVTGTGDRWNEDPDSVLSLEDCGGSDMESDNQRPFSSLEEKEGQCRDELEDFTQKHGFGCQRKQSDCEINQMESLNTPDHPSSQIMEGTNVIVSFQDVCDVPINEECVHTMNVLDHVMQLAEISQRDVEECQIQIENVPLGQAAPGEGRSMETDPDKNKTLLHLSLDDVTIGNQKPSAVKPFVCELCGRMYSSNSCLLRHKQTHLISKPHKCNLCDKSYSRRPLLREHIQFSHSEQHRVHQCSFCEKSFPNATRLELHVRTHTQDKPFKCQECQKGFADSSNLRRHERSHKGLRRHKCPQCGQLFSEKPALQRHQARHQGEKNYQCQHCTKSFVLKTDLQSHIILHKAAKESECSACGLTFKRQISFNLHQATTKKSARKCRVCGMGFANECKRRQHELNEHKFIINDSGFVCGCCGKSFDRLGKMVNHIREH